MLFSEIVLTVSFLRAIIFLKLIVQSCELRLEPASNALTLKCHQCHTDLNNGGCAPEEWSHSPFWMSWLPGVSKFALVQAIPCHLNHDASQLQWSIYNAQSPDSPSTSLEGWAVALLERGWKNKWNQFIWSAVTLALCQNDWDPQESLLRVEWITAFVIPGPLGQPKSKTAVDFTDCSTNHLSKHSCNAFQNMPSLTHSWFRTYECWSNC